MRINSPILTALLFAFLTFASCQDEVKKPNPLPAEETVHQTDHKHDNHQNSNDLMNEQEFESLVEKFESQDREEWQKPNTVIGGIPDLSNKIVADIGAGTGYFTFRMAPSVEKVIAIDVDERFINYIDSKKALYKADIQQKIETRLADYDDPKLKKEEVDFVLMVNTYHHIENRITYFKNLKPSLRENGQLIIIDFKAGDLPIGPPADHKLSKDQIIEELTTAGYTDIRVDTKSLQYQDIIIAL